MSDSQNVKCPNDCIIDFENQRKVVEKEFTFITGETGERNYCCRCGTELEEVKYGFRVAKFNKTMLPGMFKERDVATEITKGLPEDAELADIDVSDEHLNLYFKSNKWEQTNLDKPVKEIELEFKEHPIKEIENGQQN